MSHQGEEGWYPECVVCMDCYDKSQKEHSKTHSSFSKIVKRLKARCELYQNMNNVRLEQLRRTEVFTKKLLAEGRTTKEELKEYFPRLKKRN